MLAPSPRLFTPPLEALVRNTQLLGDLNHTDSSLFAHLVPSFGAIDLERPQLKQGRQLNLVAPPLPDPVGPSKLHVRPHQDKTHVSHVAVLRRAIRGVDADHDPLEIAYWATRALKRPANHKNTPY